MFAVVRKLAASQRPPHSPDIELAKRTKKKVSDNGKEAKSTNMSNKRATQ
jgi:hypothetical protein